MKLYSPMISGTLVALVALLGQPAAGQYSPYAATQPSHPQQPGYAYGQQPYQISPGYAAQQPPAGQPAKPGYTPQVVPQAVQPSAPQAYRPAYTPQSVSAQQAVAPGAYGRYAYAAPNGATQLPTPVEAVAPPTMNVAPGTQPMVQPAMPAGAAPAAAYQPAVPSAASHSGVSMGGDCGCNSAAPATNWEGYMPSSSSCGTGGCGQTGYYGDCGGADCGCYTGQACYDCGPRRQWFAGIYGLYMGRDNPGKALSTVVVDGAPAGNYYPDPSTDVFFFTSEADVDFAGGAEVRFGSTFGCATDPCGCMSYQPFAWELGYWALAEDTNFSETVDTFGGSTRMYGMIDYAGIQYDRDGSGTTYGYRPVNDYYDYQQPIDSTSTNDIRVLAVRVTQSFQVQNLELNFWRFGCPAPNSCCQTGCGPSAGLGSGMLRRAIGMGGGQCGNACGGQCAGQCSGDVYGACGCSTDACCQVPSPRRRFFINGLAGVRYLRMDESFRNAVFFTNGTDTTSYGGSMPTTGADAEQVLFHDVEVDNDLLGFQLGSSMNCLIGCRWTLFCDTNFGIYGNDIESYQRVFSPGGGDVQFVNGGEAAAVRSSKTDVAFLGEARCGIGYQLTKRCRLTTAYRVIAISGVALGVEQITEPQNPEAWQHIDSNDSLVIHGFQGGVEFKY